VTARIILKCDERNRVRMCGMNSTGLRYNSLTGSCEHSNKYSGSMKGREFFDLFSDYQLLEEDFNAVMHSDNITREAMYV
jgi:hypothetical protein